MDLAVEAKPRMVHEDEIMATNCLNISILQMIFTDNFNSAFLHS